MSTREPVEPFLWCLVVGFVLIMAMSLAAVVFVWVAVSTP